MTEYKELRNKLIEYQEVNKVIFTTADALNDAIITLEADIKAEAKTGKEDVEHDGVLVKVIRRFSKWYDHSELQKKELKELETAGGLKHEVIKEVFEKLVHDNLISQESRAKAFREEELSPAVSIKII